MTPKSSKNGKDSLGSGVGGGAWVSLLPRGRSTVHLQSYRLLKFWVTRGGIEVEFTPFEQSALFVL